MTILVINALRAISMGLREPSVGESGEGSLREMIAEMGCPIQVGRGAFQAE